MYFLSEVYDFYKLNKSTGEIQKIPILNGEGTELSFQCGGAIHRDKKGNLWFKICDGRGNGTLVKFNPETELFKLYTHNQLIRDIAISEDGKIWVIHHSDKDKRGRLSYFDPVQEQFQPSSVDIDFPEPRFCYAEGDSILWIGTLKGLVKINRLKKTSAIYTTENTTMPNDRIIVISKGPNKQLLLGTFGKGLMLFDPHSKKVKAFNEESGLVNNYVCGVLPIDENHYWLSTFRGLSYFDSEKSLFYNYKAKDGFTNNEFNRYAFHQASDGSNYLGTINGANAFQTQDLEPVKKENNIGISAIRKYFGSRDETDLLNYNLDDIKSIELPTDLTYIEFDFHQKSFTQSAPQHFYTRLLPIDKEWTFLRNRESARYRTLPPGEYTLEVLASNSENPLRLTIISKAPFYKTLPFNTLVIALGLMGIFLFARNRYRKAQEVELAKEINNRKIAELKLTALQAQMNPHFIFNALGAIQYFIQVNEVEAADHYLTRFAQLMRKYLDSSKEKLISLKKEIELLEIYVDLERLRFSESFDFTLEVGEDLEPEDIHLPSMMIQPFIENAVNHGLNQRQDGKGLLLIRFSKKGNNLHCEIIDNGIGYKNAQKNKRKGHQSRGMIIINEKINSLLNAGIMEIEIKTSEWDPSNTAFPGTRVLLEIKNFEND
ncbi:MAG: histidine kinase [Saprospiraceae bacterium]